MSAVRKLAAAPDKALPFLKSKLQPVSGLDRKRAGRLISDLQSSRFPIRARANKELTKSGVLVLDMLRQKLQDPKIELETRMRIEQLVKQAQNTAITPDEPRAVRAVLVLQQIGNAEAKSLLTEFAKGSDGAILTGQAQNALRILDSR